MPKSSENKSNPEQDSKNEQGLRAKITAECKRLGIKHAELPKKLEGDVAAAVAKANERAENLLKNARNKADTLRSKAEQRAVKRVLSPAHVCRALSQLHTRKETVAPTE